MIERILRQNQDFIFLFCWDSFTFFQQQLKAFSKLSKLFALGILIKKVTRKKFCNAIFGDSKSFSLFAARFFFLFLIFAVKVLAGESAIKLVQQIYDWQHNTQP